MQKRLPVGIPSTQAASPPQHHQSLRNKPERSVCEREGNESERYVHFDGIRCRGRSVRLLVPHWRVQRVSGAGLLLVNDTGAQIDPYTRLRA